MVRRFRVLRFRLRACCLESIVPKFQAYRGQGSRFGGLGQSSGSASAQSGGIVKVWWWCGGSFV